ncbi:MAG: hypothetical protein BGO11_11590 [Solirubrobacterales bacterium 70-9]|nr:MAG: hypothetical protein BGO11_11590 [Solirubrobacterales bacterium 70-9]
MSGPMIMEHASVTVTDLDRSLRFYIEAFGFELLRRGGHTAYLHHGDELLELLEREGEAGFERPVDKDGWWRLVTHRLGITHLGFRVDDFDSTLASIQEHGGELVVPPFEYVPEIEDEGPAETEKLRRALRPPAGVAWRLAVIADPDGTLLEILER